MNNSGKPSKLPGGFYPGESLWSIVNRFVWLNRTTLNETKNVFKELLLNRCSHFVLKTDSRYFHSIDNHSELFKSLKFTNRQFRLAVPPRFIRNSHRLRFCPDCARQGFHASVFQLPIFDRCPAHGTRLESKCSSCGSIIEFHIRNDTVKNPYACQVCGKSLVESRTLFFMANLPQGINKIRRATRWLHGLDKLTIGWGDFPSFDWCDRNYRGVDDHRLMTALASATGLLKMIPGANWPIGQLKLGETNFFYMDGIVNLNEKNTNESLHIPNYEAIYKSFLRQKTRQLRLTLLQHGGFAKIRMTPAMEHVMAFPDLMKLVFSMLFFRSHCESWRPDKEFIDSIDVACYRRVHGKIRFPKHFLRPNPSTYLGGSCKKYFESGRLPQAVQVRAEGILFIRQLSWIWREASDYATEMVNRGRILRRPPLGGIYMPQFYTLTRSQDSSVFRLDFWSGPKTLYRPDFANAWCVEEEARVSRCLSAAISALDRD